LDEFYTKLNVARDCLSFIKNFVDISTKDIIIEPSAGDGSFIKGIKSLCPNYLFLDVNSERKDILKQDYLTLDVGYIADKYRKCHVIGNPPFGRQSSLAIKFIKKSCEYCDTISFILPRSFKKESRKKFFPLNFYLKFEQDLPSNSFLINNQSHDVPCVFQIWEKTSSKRKEPEKVVPLNFLFVKKNEAPTIAVRRVGANAGRIDWVTSNKNEHSHYFIKFVNFELSGALYEKLMDIKYKNVADTIGPKSISKQELTIEFNAVIGEFIPRKIIYA